MITGLVVKVIVKERYLVKIPQSLRVFKIGGWCRVMWSWGTAWNQLVTSTINGQRMVQRKRFLLKGKLHKLHASGQRWSYLCISSHPLQRTMPKFHHKFSTKCLEFVVSFCWLISFRQKLFALYSSPYKGSFWGVNEPFMTCTARIFNSIHPEQTFAFCCLIILMYRKWDFLTFKWPKNRLKLLCSWSKCQNWITIWWKA